jgi:acyl-CoA synthetase (AMP-forming)/AMP-acid ligase II
MPLPGPVLEAPVDVTDLVRDGRLDSGDLARADEDGYLWFFGRKKQIIVHDGSNSARSRSRARSRSTRPSRSSA